MFNIQYLYFLAGLVLLVVSVLSFADKANPRRMTTGLFWGLYGLTFMMGNWAYDLVGQWLGDSAAAKRQLNIGVGAIVVLMALVAGLGGVRMGATISVRQSNVSRARKNWAIACLSLLWPSRLSPY